MPAMPKFHPTVEAIENLKLEDVPTLLRDRYAPRKQQAVAARTLFRQLGLKGISVTVPVYSMACSVHVRIPKVPTNSEMHQEWEQLWLQGKQGESVMAKVREREHKAELKLMEILNRAFPNHVDRSDAQSDHFDYRWSIN